MSKEDSDDKHICHLLEKLPAELRNRIYEEALGEDTTGEIELATATPPTKALLLSCRQIYNEAAGIYRYAYCRFWTTNNFVVDSRKVEVQHKLCDARRIDWDYVKRVKIVRTLMDGVEEEHVCSDGETWTCKGAALVVKYRVSDCPLIRSFLEPRDKAAFDRTRNKSMRSSLLPVPMETQLLWLAGAVCHSRWSSLSSSRGPSVRGAEEYVYGVPF